MKKYFPNIRHALILTPAIFLLALWMLILSSGMILSSLGLLKSILWALLLSFGSSYSIVIFVDDIFKKRDDQRK